MNSPPPAQGQVLDSPSAPNGVKSVASSEATPRDESHKENSAPSIATSPAIAAESAPLANAAPPPWQAVLDQQGEPPPYIQFAFQSVEESFGAASTGDPSPWFEKAPDSGFRLGKLATQLGTRGTIEGLGRLKCPWPADGVMRLALDNCNRLRLHFFHELAGITLVYYEDQNYRWAAYATTREAGKSTPSTWAITATDDDRCRRSELRYGGTIELRYRSGELILSRGDLVLLTAPLAAPPTDVFVEGRATVLGISLLRAAGDPKALPNSPPSVEIDKPADLSWQATHEAVAKPTFTSDGGVRLAADNAKERTECFTALPHTGLQEVILQLEDVTPGAGVYLGHENGVPQEVLRFYQDERSGRLVARLSRQDDEWKWNADSSAEKPVALVQPQCWVKLLYGCGSVRWWLSVDGIHWAQADKAAEDARPTVTSIGLQVVGKRPDTHLTLRRIVLRPLAGISSLASDELLQRATPNVEAPSLAKWTEAALSQKPEGIDAQAWLRASTIRTLAAGASRDLAYALLEALLDDAQRRGLPWEKQLAALDDAMLLCTDLRDGQALRVGIPSRYLRLAIQAGETAAGLAAWQKCFEHYQVAPAAASRETPLELDRALRWVLVRAAYSSQPEETVTLLCRLKFFNQHRERPLVEFVESLAERGLSNRPAGQARAQGRETSRELLIEELSKETYNAMTELAAVLESQAWDDAARLVASFEPEAAPGIAPYVNDRSLLASLPVAIQLTQGQYPQLREALGDRFAALAKLRINQAIAAGDVATIELATVQFDGTEAAADAHRWLGDRALASGWFARAMAEYDRAQQAAPALAADLMPRLRLAAAMLGREAGSPVVGPVQFGEVSLSAADFEALVAEMRSREQSTALADPITNLSPAPVPAPSSFELGKRSRLDGALGERPQEEVARRTNQLRVPWADRQLATTIVGDTLYVSNRFQVAAYDLTRGERLWQSQSPQGSMQRAQDWPLIPMRPLVTADRIYVRLLYSTYPQIACLERSSGKLLWAAESRDREPFVSDPLLVQGQLVVLRMEMQQEQGQLRWCLIDSQTGEIMKQRDLVRLRRSWTTRSCCEVTTLEDGLVAVLGGVTLSVDSAGKVRWVRTHTTLPTDDDPRWVLQVFQPPLVRGDRIFVAQPGVRTVDCLAPATGQRHWSAVLPELEAIVGQSGDRLIVRTETELQALDIASGQVLWHSPAENLYSFQRLDDQRLLLASRERVGAQKDQWQVRLTWLDPATGAPTATTPLPALADADPRLGPVVAYKDRLFILFGRGQHDPAREVVELIPKGTIPVGSERNMTWK